MTSSGKYDALKDLSLEEEESLMDTSTINSRKRKHPSNQEPGTLAKHNHNIGAKSPPSTPLDNRPTSKLSMENFRYEKADKGPYNILLTVHNEHVSEGDKSLLDIIIARKLTKNYNVHFNSLERKGKNKWMLTFQSRDHANKALSNTLIANSPFLVEVPWYAVFRRFVVSGIPTNIEDDELLAELKEQNPDIQVIEVSRFKKFTHGENISSSIPLTSVKVTVRGQVIPKYVKLWNIKKYTRIFIPNMRQCFKCGQLSHSTKYCKNTTKCLKCGQDYTTFTQHVTWR